MKFEIKDRYNGSIFFSLGCDSFKSCVEAAVKSGANLSGADLSGANLSGADLSGANLSHANLSGADLSGANLSGANLSRADLSGADLSGANLSHANLSGANLSRADLSHANLSGADLSGANLSCADLSGADLSGANLSGAYLSGADLSGAYLSGANLSGADLSGANLSRADLSGANLSRANLSGAVGVIRQQCCPLDVLKDQPGKIRAYKLVTSDYMSPMSDKKLCYKNGATLTVENADTSDEHCSRGISVATLDWCLREYSDGQKVMLVEFTAKDIASIPLGTDGKFRLHKCNVIRELTRKELGFEP